MKVISGGQTGADQAGWRAAKATGLEVGGWMPKRFKTENGFHPEFAELYGAKEHASPEYPHRTEANIRDADVTLWFGDPTSRGARATYKAFRLFRETGPDPGICYVREGWIAVTLPKTIWPTPDDVVNYLRKMPHDTINIAGNRESSSPGIGAWVEQYLTRVFRLLKG